MAQPATEHAPAEARPRRSAGPAEPPEDATEAVMGLDMVLVDAAQGPLRRFVPPLRTTLHFGSALARRPATVAKRTSELVRELGRITVGRSELAPGKKDKRFADPAWSGNPFLKRAMQTHLAAARTA
ncbi:MAG TPA: poly(3-hydroxyalkanoate) polymerase, partial [Blastococcus sp.]